MEDNGILLDISLGQKTYVLKRSEDGDSCKDVTVKFNPTDTLMAKRIYEAFEDFDDLATNYSHNIDGAKNAQELFKITDELEREMRKRLDLLFQKNISDDLLGEVSCCASVDGAPIWVNILLAVFDKMESSYAEERKLSSEKIKKYTDKYSRKING